MFSDSDTEIIEDYEMYVHDDENRFSEEDDPSSNMPPRKKHKRDGTPWRIVNEKHSQKEMPKWKGDLPNPDCVREPINYFRDFFDNEILEHIVEQSNIYAIQRNPNKPLNLDRNELEQFIGTLFVMSLTKITNTRLYWATGFAMNDISDYFSRNRWQCIKWNLHCANNDEILPRDHPNYDPLFKIRPLITHLQKKFRSIPPSQMMCVDEQLVSFKGQSYMKQYIPSKPHKWGFKVFALCDTAGIQYDFEVYTGKAFPVPGEPDLGPSSNIVLQLAKTDPDDMNHLLYFDNWFTSVPLVNHLAKKKFTVLQQ